MAVTQKRIADELGLSRDWVTRALNDNPKVPLESRRKVQEFARQLGYNEHSNKGARTMAARRLGRPVRHNVIAVVLWSDPLLHGAPYYSELLEGIELATAESGLDLFFFRQTPGKPLPRQIAESEVDGVVSVVPDSEHIRQLRALEVPAVMVYYATSDLPSLVPDEYQGIRMATQHLIDLGHRRIAYVGLEHWASPSGAIRFAAYKDTLHKNGLEPNAGWIHATLKRVTMDCAATAIDGLLDNDSSVGKRGGPGFTAVVCYNDQHGIGVMGRLQERGWSVPGDIAVVGFDDVAHLRNLRPALTSIGFDRAAMGRRAVEILLSHDENRCAAGEAIPEVFPVGLRIRESTSAHRKNSSI